jgi:hypothetical protein
MVVKLIVEALPRRELDDGIREPCLRIDVVELGSLGERVAGGGALVVLSTHDG